MSAVIQRILAVLKLFATVTALSKQAKAIVAAMTNNPSFPSPTPPLATVTNDISALDTAEALALGRGKGTAAARDVKKAVVIRDLQQLRFYVQTVADNDPEHSASIISSAGMSVRQITRRQRQQMNVEQGAASGIVALIAAVAARKALYQWAWSIDQRAWTLLPPTFLSKTTAHGFTAGTTYYFRYQVVTRAGVGDWSQIVSLIVK